MVRRAGARRAWRSGVLTGCLVLGVLVPGAVDAQAATPSSLAGETFTSQHVNGSTLMGVCDDEGGSFSFSVSGTAAGPFPGSFRELGSFTALPDGFLTNFSSTFTITSTSGAVTVTGAKSLVGDFSQVNCDDGFLDTNNDFTTAYTAAINGTGMDHGAATVKISGLVGLGSPIFSESFGTQFKNQGDCVSFFATGGKNPPSG